MFLHALCPSLSVVRSSNALYGSKPPSGPAKVTPLVYTFSLNNWYVLPSGPIGERYIPVDPGAHQASLTSPNCFKTLEVTRTKITNLLSVCIVMSFSHDVSKQTCNWLYFLSCWNVLCNYNHGRESPGGTDRPDGVSNWQSGYNSKSEK